jgi:glycosyltransferase involved in cell wall biosynthesis
MKVLQLIDSLNAGGAERMAITLANTLSENLKESFLCATRSEGILKNSIHSNTTFLFLGKKGTLDVTALLRLRKFVRQNKISIVHAHTTSYFFATLLKLTLPAIKLIWHEHHGKRVTTNRSHNLMLYLCSLFFSSIITVNEDLRVWCTRHLATKKVTYLPNFVMTSPNSTERLQRDKTIICLANLREPKNHLNLLKAFLKIHHRAAHWKLQIVGSDYSDRYSEDLKEFISENRLVDVVDLLGGGEDTANLLKQASIGVLSSDSEGLPMALLEYGAAGLAVVTTRVGSCEEVISTFGITVPAQDSEALSEALLLYTNDQEKRLRDAKLFKTHIETNYSQKAVLPQLLALYYK